MRIEIYLVLGGVSWVLTTILGYVNTDGASIGAVYGFRVAAVYRLTTVSWTILMFLRLSLSDAPNFKDCLRWTSVTVVLGRSRL